MADIFFFVVLEVLAFIVLIPSLLWAGLKKIAGIRQIYLQGS